MTVTSTPAVRPLSVVAATSRPVTLPTPATPSNTGIPTPIHQPQGARAGSIPTGGTQAGASPGQPAPSGRTTTTTTPPTQPTSPAMSGASGLIRPLTLASASTPAAAPASVAGERGQPGTVPKASGAGTTISPLSSGGGGQSGGGGGQSGSSGGGGNPTITFNGDNVVGGFGEVVLTAPAQLQTVNWQVSGAVQNPQNPPLTNSQGAAPTALPNPDPVTKSGQSAILDFYWNLQTGNHTISASVVYAGKGTGTSNTITVNVVAPTVKAFQVSYTPYTWGTIPAGSQQNQEGFFGTFTYSATVSLPATAQLGQGGAQFAFIQLVSVNDTETTKLTGPHTLNTNGMVLDNYPTLTQPGDAGYLLNNATYSKIPIGGQLATPIPSPTDTPSVAWVPSKVNGDIVTELNVTTTFATNLVFQSARGIWVGLSVTTPVLTLKGDEVWNGAKWVQGAFAPTPATAGNLGGNNSLQWVTWSGYYTSFTWKPAF